MEKWILIFHSTLISKCIGRVDPLPDKRYSVEYYLFLPEKYDNDNKKIAYYGKTKDIPPYLRYVIPEFTVNEYVIVFDNWR